MDMRRMIRFAVVLVAVTLGAGRFASAEEFRLATATPGGTFHPAGVALSTLVKVQLLPQYGIDLTAVNTAGSGANVRMLASGEVQFALLAGLYGVYARNGSGPFETQGPNHDLRAITTLWQNVEHFVIKSSHARTGTISDLAGMGGIAGFGQRESGSLGLAEHLLANLGIDLDRQFHLYYGGYSALAHLMEAGRLDFVGMPGGEPVVALTRLYDVRAQDLTMLEFTPEQARQADGGIHMWLPYRIPAGTYPGLDHDIHTIAQPTILAVRADVPEPVVYQITKAIYDNIDMLHAIHPVLGSIPRERAMGGLSLPLHPGALRYFEESGVAIPDYLRADASGKEAAGM